MAGGPDLTPAERLDHPDVAGCPDLAPMEHHGHSDVAGGPDLRSEDLATVDLCDVTNLHYPSQQQLDLVGPKVEFQPLQ